MQYVFKVVLHTDEANESELEQAIAEALRTLPMPNGETLYVDWPQVDRIA